VITQGDSVSGKPSVAEGNRPVSTTAVDHAVRFGRIARFAPRYMPKMMNSRGADGGAVVVGCGGHALALAGQLEQMLSRRFNVIGRLRSVGRLEDAGRIRQVV